MSRTGHWLVGAVALLALTACQLPRESPTATARAGANAEDVDFITNSYQLITLDREEGTLAGTQATDPRVRALAAKMVADADGFAEKLAPLAAAEGIRPPDILRYGLRVRLGHMRLQNGLDFDRTFVDDQIASHQEAIAMYEMTTGSGGSPALGQVAKSAGPIVRANLRQLQELQARMAR